MIKGLIVGATLTLAVAGLPFADAQAATQKITYCHVPAGNPANAHTITTSIRAVMRPGHALIDVDGNVIEIGGHGGDYLGECKSTESTSKPPVKPSDTSTKTDNPTQVILASGVTVTELPYTGTGYAGVYALVAAAFAGTVTELGLWAKTILRRPAA